MRRPRGRDSVRSDSKPGGCLLGAVRYELTGEPIRTLIRTPSDHHKSFEVVAMLAKERCQSGKGRSKKEAEQVAARETLRSFLGPEETWGERY